MRRLLFGLALAAAFLFSAPSHAQVEPVNETVDRFTGDTTLSYKTTPYNNGWQGQLSPPTVHFNAVAKSDGQQTFSMLFMVGTSTSLRSGGGWRFLGVNKIDWLVDGKPFNVARADRDGRVQRGFVMEIYIQPFTREEFEALANSESQVEFRIGTDEFRLSAVDATPMQEMLQRMPPPAPKPGPKAKAK